MNEVTSRVRTDRIVIAGLPRSGTTYVGKILDLHPDVRMVLEPMNEEFGLRAVPGQFPYVGDGSSREGQQAAALLAQMVELRGGWTRFRMSRGKARNPLQKAAKVLVGSRTSWDWRLDALGEAVGRPRVPVQLFKDPFVTFSLDHLANHHHLRSVCLVRHPGAYYYSFSTQPWEHGSDRIPSIEELRDDLGGIEDALWTAARSDKLAYCALLWKLMARYISRCPSLVMPVRHEDLSADVETEMARICEHFELEFTASMKEFVQSSSTGSKVAPEYLQVRSFDRDSSKVADYWRGKLSSADETRLQEAVGEDLTAFYDQW